MLPTLTSEPLPEYEASEAFVDAYAACAVWSSTDEDGEPLDAVHSVDDVHPDAMKAMRQDCDDFVRANHADLAAAATARSAGTGLVHSYDDSDAGHDFWLTRCRHGAGFWSRGLGAIGARLTAAAKAHGNRDLYVGDDGMIHVG